MAAACLLLGSVAAAPAFAQLSAPPVAAAPVARPLVKADPYRVFGDEAPIFAALGVFGALGIGVSASLQTQYSDNVARVEDEEDPGRLTSKGDWMFRPSLSLSAARGVGRGRFFLNGNVGREYYVENTQLNSNRFGVGGGVSLPVGTRCGANIQGGYSNRGTQLGFFEEVIPSTSEAYTFSTSANCRTAGGITGSIGYSRSKRTNDSDDPLNQIDRSFADARSQGFTGSLGRAIGPRGQAGVNASWSKQEYPNQLLATGGINNNEVVSGGIYGSYAVGSSLSANAGIGLTKLSSDVAGTQGFKGTTWNAGVNYSRPRFGVSLSTGRGVDGASGSSANYSIGSFFNIGANYRSNDRLGFSTGYARSNTTFRGIDQLPETLRLSSSINNRVFLGADYRLNRRLNFSLDLNHQSRSSEPSDFSFKENSATLTISTSF